MPRFLALLALALTAGCGLFEKPATTPTAPVGPHVVHASWSPGNGRFFYAAGTSGTVTVAAGSYVTGISCHASASGATLTITPDGPDVTSPVAGPAIPVPAGAALSISKPLLTGNSDELGTGSSLVFSGTDAYLVVLFQAGGP